MVNFEQRNIKGGTLSNVAIEGKDPQFDAWLSEQLQFDEPYLDDDGFCESVMAKLPAPSQQSERRASRFQYIAVLAASGIVAWQFPFGEVLSEAAHQSISLYSLVGVGMLSSLVVMAGGIFAARR
ncbi:hypothetical protein [Microbulbifer sp. GL-2]|uniref:hypothetical protein n=1 Tax=Microbulbifer sp. GL-2 TaxID=2591606 RepID=UPI0011645ABC|nr:hypothetical protein [Microbulbifer sp. GL-2]BBM02926.1 hypothetical protein GL2_30000 [Microbulbifer sp. GL-2]